MSATKLYLSNTLFYIAAGKHSKFADKLLREFSNKFNVQYLDRYEYLSTSEFLTTENEAMLHYQKIKEVCPEGPYYLSGKCGGGLISVIVAKLLEENGDEVKAVWLLDSIYFNNEQIANSIFNEYKENLDTSLDPKLKNSLLKLNIHLYDTFKDHISTEKLIGEVLYHTTYYSELPVGMKAQCHLVECVRPRGDEFEFFPKTSKDFQDNMQKLQRHFTNKIKNYQMECDHHFENNEVAYKKICELIYATFERR